MEKVKRGYHQRMLKPPFSVLPSLPLDATAATFPGGFGTSPFHCEVKLAEAIRFCDVDMVLCFGSFQLGSRHHAPPFLWESSERLPVVNMAADRLVPGRSLS